MRKRNVCYVLNEVLWWLLMLLPMVLWGLSSIAHVVPSGTFFEQISLLPTQGIFYQPLVEFFSIIEIEPSGVLCGFLAWIITVTIMRLVVSVILFIPKMALNWFENFGQNEVKLWN